MDRFKILLLTAIVSLMGLCIPATAKEHKTILVISGWQDVNIGDIAHTPGFLNVLQTYMPEADILLWEKNVGSEVEGFLRKNFPKVRIVHGTVDENLVVSSEEIKEAFKEADIMIHGSGPSVVGQYNLEAWVKYTGGKPFGIFGTTIQHVDQRLGKLLNQAAFIFTRETASLAVLDKAGVKVDRMGFIPDATFFFDCHDQSRADSFLRGAGLKEDDFICVVPRLRKTPYYLIKNRHKWTEKGIMEVEAHNAKYKESDHARLREAMVRWIRETGKKILVCPEMTYEVDIMDELLIDPLPEDVKPYVIKRGYWLPDEAASVYSKAVAVLSFECHSPIIAAANGTPFFYLRQPDDTIKGQMYYDLGYNDWIFEIEQTEGRQIANRLMEVYSHRGEARARIRRSQKRIAGIYRKACEVIRETL